MLRRTPLSKRWLLTAALLLALLPLPAFARTSGPSTPPPTTRAPASSEVVDIGLPVGDWLALVPDTESTRSWLSVGDVEAWFDETGIERPASIDALKTLDDDEREPILFDLAAQTIPPEALNVDTMIVEDLLALYGYDLLNTLQTLEAGMVPDQLTVLRVANSPAAVGTALEASGYTASTLSGATLYSRREDNEIDVSAATPSGRLATLNRIAVLDRGIEGEADLLVARATGTISGSLDALAGEGDSLAGDMGYRTLARAVDFESLVPGSPVGLIVLGGEQEPLTITTTPEAAADLEARLAEYAAEPLPPYRLAAFGTSRDGDDTYLTLYLVLAPGEAAQPTATILSDRLEEYRSLVGDRLLFDGVEIVERGAFVSELEVAYVTMRALPEAASVFDWIQPISARDLLFLAPGE